MFVMLIKIKLNMYWVIKKLDIFCYFWVLGLVDRENIVKIYSILEFKIFKFLKVLL